MSSTIPGTAGAREIWFGYQKNHKKLIRGQGLAGSCKVSVLFPQLNKIVDIILECEVKIKIIIIITMKGRTGERTKIVKDFSVNNLVLYI